MAYIKSLRNPSAYRVRRSRDESGNRQDEASSGQRAQSYSGVKREYGVLSVGGNAQPVTAIIVIMHW